MNNACLLRSGLHHPLARAELGSSVGACVICIQGRSTALSNIGWPRFVQPLNAKPNLVLAFGPVDVYADTWQPLDFVLVQSEETVCGDGSGWLAP